MPYFTQTLAFIQMLEDNTLREYIDHLNSQTKDGTHLVIRPFDNSWNIRVFKDKDLLKMDNHMNLNPVFRYNLEVNFRKRKTHANIVSKAYVRHLSSTLLAHYLSKVLGCHHGRTAKVRGFLPTHSHAINC
jgi:hypothetical protein